MKSYGLVFPEPGVAEIEDFDIRDPAEGEVLLEAECSLISPGTERTWFLNGGEDTVYPQRVGYSLSGRVLRVGAGVTRFCEGDRVVANARHAAHALVRADAAFLEGPAGKSRTEPVSVKSGILPIPDNVDHESAAFFHLGITAILGVRRARIELGEAVGVIGQGVVGLLALKFAQLNGAAPIVAFDLDESRLMRSRKYGADVTVDANNEGAIQRLKESLPGGGLAAVIEVSGLTDPMELAVDVTRTMGRVVVLGTVHGEVQGNPYRQIFDKGLSVIGSYIRMKPVNDSQPGLWAWEQDGATFFSLLSKERLEVNSLITHHFSGKEAPAAFELVREAEPSLIGGILHWHD